MQGLPSNKEVREWAEGQRVAVPARGSVGYGVMVAYLKAHPAVARALAHERDVDVPQRGRLSEEQILEVL